MVNKEELKELLVKIELAIKLKKIIIVVFLIGAVLFWIMGLFAHPEYMKWTILLLAIWLFSIFAFDFFVKKQKTFSGASNLYFVHSALVELGLLTIIIFNAGGIEWIGVIFYLSIIIYSNIILPTPKGFIFTSAAFIWYGGLVSLQYFGLIPFRPYFNLGVNLYQNPNYFLTTLFFITPCIFLAGMAANLFTDLLRKRTRELVEIRVLLEEAKSVLEIKVKARTGELKELAERREEIIKERTKELQEKLEDLEKFHKFAVGRELKMAKLKEEIEKLKKAAEKKK